jgi:hypothetical protein
MGSAVRAAEQESGQRSEGLQEVAMDDEPRLSTEIWKTALLFVKVVASFTGVATILYGLVRWDVVYGMLTFYGLMFAGMILWYGYQSYKSKLSGYRYRKEIEAERAKWEAARNRTQKSA